MQIILTMTPQGAAEYLRASGMSISPDTLRRGIEQGADEGGERADHGENGTADADTSERQITDRGNVADVHTVYNAVQNTHELCQHARKSNTGNQLSDRVGSEMVYSFHRKIPCRFLVWEQTAKNMPETKSGRLCFGHAAFGLF